MWIAMLKTRRSWDRLIFNMVIPTLVRQHLYIETAPGFLGTLGFGQWLWNWRLLTYWISVSYKLNNKHILHDWYWMKTVVLGSKRVSHCTDCSCLNQARVIFSARIRINQATTIMVVLWTMVNPTSTWPDPTDWNCPFSVPGWKHQSCCITV